MKANTNIENQIIEVLNSYANAYADKNLNTMTDPFLEDPDIVAVGTGEDEWVHGFDELKEGFKRDMNQSESINIQFKDITVSSIDNAAWASLYIL